MMIVEFLTYHSFDCCYQYSRYSNSGEVCCDLAVDVGLLGGCQVLQHVLRAFLILQFFLY